MGERPASVLKGSMDAFNAGKSDLAAEFMDPEVDYTPILAAMEGRSYHGHEGVAEFFRELQLDWEVFIVEPQKFFERGDRVLALGTWTATGRASGLELSGQQAAWVATVRDGLITHFRTYSQRQEALEHFGVADDDLGRYRVEPE